MFNSIVDRRWKEESNYKLILTVPRQEYATINEGTINDENANNFVFNYLNHIGDDGIPYDVHVQNTKNSDLLEIEASVNYMGNMHSGYSNSDTSIYENNTDNKNALT